MIASGKDTIWAVDKSGTRIFGHGNSTYAQCGPKGSQPLAQRVFVEIPFVDANGVANAKKIERLAGQNHVWAVLEDVRVATLDSSNGLLSRGVESWCYLGNRAQTVCCSASLSTRKKKKKTAQCTVVFRLCELRCTLVCLPRSHLRKLSVNFELLGVAGTFVFPLANFPCVLCGFPMLFFCAFLRCL